MTLIAAPAAEAEARAVLSSIPYVGPVTVDAVVSELGEVRRFRSQKRAAAYAGLVPGQRESAGRETGHRRGGPAIVVRDGGHVAEWTPLPASHGVAWTSPGTGMPPLALEITKWPVEPKTGGGDDSQDDPETSPVGDPIINRR